MWFLIAGFTLLPVAVIAALLVAAGAAPGQAVTPELSVATAAGAGASAAVVPAIAVAAYLLLQAFFVWSWIIDHRSCLRSYPKVLLALIGWVFSFAALVAGATYHLWGSFTAAPAGGGPLPVGAGPGIGPGPLPIGPGPGQVGGPPIALLAVCLIATVISRFRSEDEQDLSWLFLLNLLVLVTTVVQAAVPVWALAVATVKPLMFPAALIQPRRGPLAPAIRYGLWAARSLALLALFATLTAIGNTTVLLVLALVLILGAELTELMGHAEPGTGTWRDAAGAFRSLSSSLAVYYFVPFRLLQFRRLYRRFVPPGGLVFDIGAHVGNRTRVFRSLGARVAAFEPQRTCLVVLDRLCGRDGAVTILPVALGEHSGRAALHVSSDNPTLTTLSSDWIDRIDEHYGSLGIAWDREDSVEVRTLDEQIRRFGTPDFVKIDVEGFEAEVLAGLTVAVPALSFEFLPAAIENALVALRRASKIGTYRFNYSISERGKLRLKRWVDAEEMEAILAAMAPGDPSGDVYCRLVQDG